MKILARIAAFSALVIITLTVFNYSFFRAYIKLQKSAFRKQLIASSAASVETMEINSSELFKDKNGIEWHENNKEICVNGQFYEVIGIKRASAYSTLFIIKDNKENNLFRLFFSRKIKENDDVASLIKLFFGMNYVPSHRYEFVHRFFIIENSSRPDIPFSDSGFSANLLKPPASFSIFF